MCRGSTFGLHLDDLAMLVRSWFVRNTPEAFHRELRLIAFAGLLREAYRDRHGTSSSHAFAGDRNHVRLHPARVVHSLAEPGSIEITSTSP